LKPGDELALLYKVEKQKALTKLPEPTPVDCFL
jgi:hypothetical protein